MPRTREAGARAAKAAAIAHLNASLGVCSNVSNIHLVSLSRLGLRV